MKVAARAAALMSALVVFAACDDGTGPTGAPSDFEVHIYVERDDSLGMGAADVPLAATVTVTSVVTGEVLTAESGDDGVATFGALAPGSYTVAHALTAGSDAIELQGNVSQTVVAPLLGATVVTRFVYAFAPGEITGVVFRDENGSTFYEEGQDSVFAGVVLVLFAGEDTLSAPAAEDTTDANGLYDFGERAVGEYRIVVREPNGTIVLGANPREVSVAAGETTFHPIELSGDPTGPVVTIAEARDTAIGDTVKVRGVVTAGQGVYRPDSFFLQDGTAGIFVFGAATDLAVAEGDSVQVYGVRSASREQAQLTVSAVVRLGTGELPEPHTIDAAALNAGQFQGELALLTATVDSTVAGAAGLEVWVHDGSGDAVVFLDDGTGIPADAVTVGAEQAFTGVLITYDDDDDHVIDLGDRRLAPRDADDVN